VSARREHHGPIFSHQSRSLDARATASAAASASTSASDNAAARLQRVSQPRYQQPTRGCVEEKARKLPAQPRKKKVQTMRRLKHLRAQPRKKKVQTMRKKQVQTMRRRKHLRSQPRKKQVQAIPSLPESIGRCY
jgi:hypothetical protein